MEKGIFLILVLYMTFLVSSIYCIIALWKKSLLTNLKPLLGIFSLLLFILVLFTLLLYFFPSKFADLNGFGYFILFLSFLIALNSGHNFSKQLIKKYPLQKLWLWIWLFTIPLSFFILFLIFYSVRFIETAYFTGNDG